MGDMLFKKRCNTAQIPRRAFHDDVGYDIFVLRDTIVWPFCTVDVDSGVDIKVPVNCWGMIKSRSSTWRRRKLMVFEGVIDPGYTGNLSTLIYNPKLLPRYIKKGERLAQLVIIKACYPETEVVSEMPITQRGKLGFGGTGE